MRDFVLGMLLAVAAPAQGGPAIDRPGMDTSIRPGDDFWSFANGGWDKATPIPADKHTYGGAWILDDVMESRVRAIAESGGTSPAERQVRDYYRAYLDMGARSNAGASPLKPGLARIAAARSAADLVRLFEDRAMPSPLSFYVAPNPKDPVHYALFLSQGTLGLPDREYYLSADAKMAGYRTAYRAYLVRLSKLAGLPEGEARADRIIALETAIARVFWERVRLRDQKQTINPMTVAELDKLAPAFGFPAFLRRMGAGSPSTVIVNPPTAIAALDRLLRDQPLAAWKDWMTLRRIDEAAPYLSESFDRANFDFRQRTLRGIEQPPPMWQRAVRLLNDGLGDTVGQLYVARHLPPAARAKAEQLVADIVASFEERLKANSWMDEPTRAAALAKLAGLGREVGAPKKYIDYSPVRISPSDPLGNKDRLERFYWAWDAARIGKPVTTDYWFAPPQMVNAYYSSYENRMRILAGFLQPPYFDPEGDPAANYAGIGGIIGHEIGHAFDDQGRRFDQRGEMRDWWTEAAAKAFEARTARLVEQYGSYEAVPGVKLNGKLTLGENIGDLGGLEMAYAAWRRYVARNGEPPVIDGMTGDQRFFVYFAQAWREKSRPDRLRQIVVVDPHSPGKYRANGSVRNVDAWYRAFGAKPGDRLYLPPEERVHIW
ncbi:MAG TPA: M13 family metallopeptidase [Allosphingosinicella sp.]|jgi:endothelin-converting enzyme/putative endopeptidase